MISIVKDGDTLIVKIDSSAPMFLPLEDLSYMEWLRIDKYLTGLIRDSAWQYQTFNRGNGLDARQVETWVMFAAVEARPVELGRVA